MTNEWGFRQHQVLEKASFEPDLNQRPKDTSIVHYSPPLYQLSYRREARSFPVGGKKKMAIGLEMAVD